MCLSQTANAQAIKANTLPIESADIDFEVRNFKIDEITFGGNEPSLPHLKRTNKDEDWLVITLEYDWAINSRAAKNPNIEKQGNSYYYLDNLGMEWRVVLAQGQSGSPVSGSGSSGFKISPSYAVKMVRKVHYGNVSDEGTRKYATIFIDPSTIRRYIRSTNKNHVFASIIFTLNGRPLGKLSAVGQKYFFSRTGNRPNPRSEAEHEKLSPRQRPGQANFYISETVVKSQTGLKTKNETPWQWTSMDAVEYIIPEKK